MYGFAGGDPINYQDPFGLCPDACVLESGAAIYVAGIAVIATGAAIANGEELGEALAAGADAARQTIGAVAAWANNRAQGAHIRGQLNVIEKHFGFLAGAGGPDKGDPNDPRSRDKWKKDIQKAIEEARKHVDKMKGDRNKEPYGKAIEEAQKRLSETP